MTATYRVEDAAHPSDEWRDQCGLFIWYFGNKPGMALYTMWLDGIYRGCTPSRDNARAWCRYMNGGRS